MIRSFRDRESRGIFLGRYSHQLPTDVQRKAERKLKMLHAAQSLQDLLIPPGNRLEKLRGDRIGQYSVRVDRRWRVCFRWRDQNAYDVEVVDYH